MAEEVGQQNRSGKRALTLAVIFCALQVAFFVAWIWYEQNALDTGRGIIVRTAPVDPRDLLRGRYLRLNYDFNNPTLKSGQRQSEMTSLPVGSPFWVVMGRESEQSEVYVCRYGSVQKPSTMRSDEVLLRGRVAHNWRTHVEFGIEKFFIPEDVAEPSRENMTIGLKIDKKGQPRIEQLYVDGKPWP